MEKLNSISKLFVALAALSLAMAAGGLVAMWSLGLSPHTLLPQPITFALMFGSLMGALGVSAVIAEQKPNQPRRRCSGDFRE